MRQWTPEERAKQSAAIKKWKPWVNSTGPKTLAGKAAARMNALKHGARSQQWSKFKKILRAQRQFVSRIELMIKLEKEKIHTNELLRTYPRPCCHPERSEGSRGQRNGILRLAQNDKRQDSKIPTNELLRAGAKKINSSETNCYETIKRTRFLSPPHGAERPRTIPPPRTRRAWRTSCGAARY